MKALTVERISDHRLCLALLGCLQCVARCASPSGGLCGGAEGLL
jgi:hypothetical protein